jgi:hypothetical protein
MIEEIKKLDEDWYLIYLQGTRYYQIWNKWDLFEVLLDATAVKLDVPRTPFVTLWDEDFPMKEEDLKTLLDKLKDNKVEWNKRIMNKHNKK